MPALPYYRGRRFRRRRAYLRYGRTLRRRWGWRRYRRRPWFRRRYRRVRKRRARRGRRGYRRRWHLRRRRLLRRGRRYRIRLFQWSPAVRVNCYITGYGPLMWFTKRDMFKPFLDPPSGMYLGGGISCYYWTLELLWNELTMRRNRWSRSNYGFDYARFRWAKFWFYRNNIWSYCITWAQGDKADESLPWEDLHPSAQILKRNRVIMRSNSLLPYRKQYYNRKMFFRPPVDMTNQWYKMSDLATKTLVRICCTLMDFGHIWFHIPQSNVESFKGYYSSCGYKTPDVRSLYKRSEKQFVTISGSWAGDLEFVKDIYQLYRTWGGLYHINSPPSRRVLIGDRADSTARRMFGIQAQVELFQVMRGQSEQAIVLPKAEQIAISRRAAGERQIAFVNKTCKPGHINLQPSSEATAYLYESHTLLKGFETSDSYAYDPDDLSTHTMFKQFFWIGKYNPCWDSGYNNKVWGLWLPASRSAAQEAWDKFLNKQAGPPPGLDDCANFHLVSSNEPYYRVFYGHNYNSYLTYLNLKYPNIVPRSFGHRGFFAVAITLPPGYPVHSGPFPEGYAPMVYQGYNWSYFSFERHYPHGPQYEKAENWLKWWPDGQSFPPLNDKAEIDHNCKVCCLLTDGRNVLYGQRLEGTFYNVNSAKYASIQEDGTRDDIYYLGSCGPFCPKGWLDDWNQGDSSPNFYMKYKFKFQWGADRWPGQYTEIRDPTTFNDPSENPMPAGFPDPDSYVPPGSPSRKGQSHHRPKDPRQFTGPHVRRRKRSRSPDHAGGPVTDDVGRTVFHPGEVSAMSLDPYRDLDKYGLIQPGAFKRLTQSSLHTIDRQYPVRRKIGTPEDNLLWSVYRGPADGSRPSSSEKSYYESSTSESETDSEASTPPRRARAHLQSRSPSPPHPKRSRLSRSERVTVREPYAVEPVLQEPPTRPARRSSVDLGIFNRRAILGQLWQLKQLEKSKKPSTNFTDIAKTTLPVLRPSRT
ncbi:ORF1 [torque teno Delphinidae virus 52]